MLHIVQLAINPWWDSWNGEKRPSTGNILSLCWCVMDALIFNPDRHYGNFGIMFDTDTMKHMCMCPVFDNNRSLFPDLDQDQLEHPDWYLERCRPIIGKNFLITARGVLTQEIRTDLKNLLGFQFRQHEAITAPQERLDALSAIVNRQMKAILE